MISKMILLLLNYCLLERSSEKTYFLAIGMHASFRMVNEIGVLDLTAIAACKKSSV